MTKPFLLRLASKDDYPAIAAMMSIARPDYPRTKQDLLYADEHRAAYCKDQYYVADIKGEIVAYAFYTQHADLYHPQQFHIGVNVVNPFRRKGIGADLYETLLNDIYHFESESLHVRIQETNHSGLRFAEKRGFIESSRRIESRLDTINADLENLPERLALLSKQGITIRSYEDLKDDPDRDQKFYQLHTTVDSDVPIETPVTPLAFEQWCASITQHPQFLADGTFIAIHQGQYIGLSSLFKFVDDMAYVELTGTLADYRRKGISTALKLCGIQYAREQAIPRVGVTNDAINIAILAINQKMGFIPRPAIINLKLMIES